MARFCTRVREQFVFFVKALGKVERFLRGVTKAFVAFFLQAEQIKQLRGFRNLLCCNNRCDRAAGNRRDVVEHSLGGGSVLKTGLWGFILAGNDVFCGKAGFHDCMNFIEWRGLEMVDRALAIDNESQGGRLHTSYGASLAIDKGVGAGGAQPDKPVGAGSPCGGCRKTGKGAYGLQVAETGADGLGGK